jgi:hypothetical protein
MKYSYIWIIVCVLISVSAFAALPNLPRDKDGQKIQNFAPDESKKVALTINHTVTDVSNDIRFSLYTPTACKFRLLSTVTKVGVYSTLPVNANTERVINHNTVLSKFLNTTGCTNGEGSRQ